MPQFSGKEIDEHIGKRARQRRLRLGISPSEAASALGVTEDELERYESGEARLGCAALYRLSEVLDCSIGRFFGGHKDDIVAALLEPESETTALAAEVNDLVDAFRKVPSLRVRRYLLTLVRQCIKSPS